MEPKRTTSSGRTRFRSSFGLWGPPVVLSLVIFALSSTPGDRFPDHPEVLNAAVHLLEFFLLAFFLARAFSAYWWKKPRKIAVPVILICAAMGVMTELYQFSVPFRAFDPMDVLLDLAGALAGTLSFFLAKKRQPAPGGRPGG